MSSSPIRSVRIGIRSAILAAFGLVVTLMLAFLALSIWGNQRQAESLATTEAEQVAGVIAATITRSDPASGQQALYDDPAALQRYMQFLHGTQRRDLEVVAADGRILADVVPEDIGHFIEGELAAAAARLVRTGKSQRFVEISKDYPQGIRQVAVPIRRAGRIDGLIILEYTPLYDRILADSAATNRVEAAGVVLIVLVTAGLGLYTARLVGREAKARSESAQLRAVAHLANAAAHEINNPMTTVIGRLSMLAERLPAQSREVELVQIAQTESARVTKMVEHMQNITQLEYLAMAGPELPRTLDIKKSAGDRAQALKHR